MEMSLFHWRSFAAARTTPLSTLSEVDVMMFAGERYVKMRTRPSCGGEKRGVGGSGGVRRAG
jgi:hypothetical protein